LIGALGLIACPNDYYQVETDQVPTVVLAIAGLLVAISALCDNDMIFDRLLRGYQLSAILQSPCDMLCCSVPMLNRFRPSHHSLVPRRTPAPPFPASPTLRFS